MQTIENIPSPLVAEAVYKICAYQSLKETDCCQRSKEEAQEAILRLVKDRAPAFHKTDFLRVEIVKKDLWVVVKKGTGWTVDGITHILKNNLRTKSGPMFQGVVIVSVGDGPDIIYKDSRDSGGSNDLASCWEGMQRRHCQGVSHWLTNRIKDSLNRGILVDAPIDVDVTIKGGGDNGVVISITLPAWHPLRDDGVVEGKVWAALRNCAVDRDHSEVIINRSGPNLRPATRERLEAMLGEREKKRYALWKADDKIGDYLATTLRQDLGLPVYHAWLDADNRHALVVQEVSLNPFSSVAVRVEEVLGEVDGLSDVIQVHLVLD